MEHGSGTDSMGGAGLNTHLPAVSEADEWSNTSAPSAPDSPGSSDGRPQWPAGSRREGMSESPSGSHSEGTSPKAGEMGGLLGGFSSPTDMNRTGPLEPIREQSRTESFDSKESRESGEDGSSFRGDGLARQQGSFRRNFSAEGSFKLGSPEGSFNLGSGSFHKHKPRRSRRRRSMEEERKADQHELDQEAKALMERRKTFEEHLMKIPRKNRAKAVRCNCTEEQLQSPVWKFLIDVMITGRGENDPVGIKDAEDVDFIYEQLVEKSQHTLYTPGPVGDLPMHMVFLLAYGHANTPKMLQLGKKLIEEYYTGDDINMHYTSDLDTPVFKHLDFRPEDSGKYTGETVLHIAIVNKDLETAQWLLDRNASLESRATGAFFRPTVIRRRSKRARGVMKKLQKWVQNRDLKSEPFMKERLNLEGAFPAPRLYFGEFPLSFAASMGDVDMCQLLHDFMARAKPHEEGYRLSEDELQKQKKKRIWRLLNAQDDLGNTALHMAVMHKRKTVFDWLHANGAESSMRILNEDALTPFTLAVRNGFTDMYMHIYNKYFSDVVFKFGEMQLNKTSLEQIDTFRIEAFPLHSDARWRSALEVITTHEVSELSRDTLYNELIQAKWSAFGLRMFMLRTVIPYAMYVALFMVATWFRCRDVREGWKNVQLGLREYKDVGLYEQVLVHWRDGYVLFQLCTQILLVFTSLYILVMGVMTRRLGPRDMDPDEDGGTATSKIKRIIHKNLIFILNTAVSGCVIGSTGFRIAGSDRMEMAMLAVGNVLIFCNFLQTLAPIKPIGVLVILIWRIAVHDVLICLALYMTLLCAFSGAQFVMYQRSDFVYSLEASGGMRLDTWPTTAMLRNIYVSMGEVNITDLLLMSNTPWLVLLLHITWIVVANVLMMNLLIAMMSSTIDDGLQYAHEMWIFPFAREVLRYERMLKEESTMTGPSIWRPSYSIKYICSEIWRAAYKFFRKHMCRLGSSDRVAPSPTANSPENKRNELSPTTRSHSMRNALGRQDSMKAPPVKPLYDQTSRRNFLVNRTGESDQTHKKFMSEEEISKAKFYRMSLTLGNLSSRGSRKPEAPPPAPAPRRLSSSGSVSSTSSDAKPGDPTAAQKLQARLEARELLEEVVRLKESVSAIKDVNAAEPGPASAPLSAYEPAPAPALSRRSNNNTNGSFSSKASQEGEETPDEEVKRQAKREMEKGLSVLDELCKAIDGLESMTRESFSAVQTAGLEISRMKEACKGRALPETESPAKQRRVGGEDEDEKGRTRLRKVEQELEQNRVMLPGALAFGDEGAGEQGGEGASVRVQADLKQAETAGSGGEEADEEKA